MQLANGRDQVQCVNEPLDGALVKHTLPSNNKTQISENVTGDFNDSWHSDVPGGPQRLQAGHGGHLTFGRVVICIAFLKYKMKGH